MKRLGTVILLLFGLLAPVAICGTVAADSASATQELHVSARVLPMRHIIINQSGQIIEITSNTSDNIKPQVFLGSDVPANVRPLTDEILKSYKLLAAPESAKTGILYRRPATLVTSNIPFSLSFSLTNLRSSGQS